MPKTLTQTAMPKTQAQAAMAKYLDEYYGFPATLDTEIQAYKKAIKPKELAELDKYIEQCIANREEPDLKSKPTKGSKGSSAGDVNKPAPQMDTKKRYIALQLVKKVSALRLEAINEAARPDRTVDMDKLVKALSAREKKVPKNTPKELKELLGSNPTVDIAARQLAGLQLDLSQVPTTEGFWDYVCRARCCIWGWRCSLGCIIIGCWV